MNKKPDKITELYIKLKNLENKNKETSYEIVKFRSDVTGTLEQLKYIKVKFLIQNDAQKNYDQLSLEYTMQEKDTSALINELSILRNAEDEYLASHKIKEASQADLKSLNELNFLKTYLSIIKENNSDMDSKYLFQYKSKILKDEIDEEKDEKYYREGQKKLISVQCSRVVMKSLHNYKYRDSSKQIKHSTSLQKFHFDRRTSFAQLKQNCCAFWVYSVLEEQFFDMADEYGAILPLNDNIYDFYRLKGRSANTSLVQIIARSDKNNLNPELIKKLLTSTGDANRTNFDESSFEREQNKPPTIYESFFEQFPGMKVRAIIIFTLKKYIDSEQMNELAEWPIIKPGKKKFLKRKVDDNSFCVCFWLMIQFFLLLASISGHLNIKNLYSNTIGVRNLLQINSEQITFDFALQDVVSSAAAFTYFQYVIIEAYFLENLNVTASNKFLANNIYIGPVRIRQVKTANNSQDCMKLSHYPYTINCYYGFYSKETECIFKSFLNKATIPIPSTYTFPWTYHRTESESKIYSSSEGRLGTYGGSGYYIDFWGNDYYQKSQSSAENDVSYFLPFGFLGRGTRVIFVTANFYNPSADTFILIEMAFEFSVAGGVEVYEPEIVFFRLNRFRDGEFNQGAENFKIFLLILFMSFYLYMLVLAMPFFFILRLPIKKGYELSI